jgi:hypothetical protein
MFSPDINDARAFFNTILQSRLSPAALAYYQATATDSQPLDAAAFNKVIALASRHAKRQPLCLSSEEQAQVSSKCPGWSFSNWNLLEALRVSLILAQPNLSSPEFAKVFGDAFQFADEGELCAFYKAIPFLPQPERFSWHMKEACRSNMRSLFCAAACDNPFPLQHFDEIAWNQLIMKALFIEVPLAQVYGVELRLSEKLVAMTRDFIAERTSAGRGIPQDTHLLVGWSPSLRAVN